MCNHFKILFVEEGDVDEDSIRDLLENILENMENKFDRINHSFMYRFLEKFGFNIQFTRKIKACIRELHIAPLVNERPAIFFQMTQGIRKGCLLSPFLYILIVESLRRKFHMEMAVGNLLGIKMT